MGLPLSNGLYLQFIGNGIPHANGCRQCQGQTATSCSVLNIQGGCSDVDFFESERLEVALQVECINRSKSAKRTVVKEGRRVKSLRTVGEVR